MCVYNEYDEHDGIKSNYRCGRCDECGKEEEDRVDEKKKIETSCQNCGRCEECYYYYPYG